MQFQRYQRTKEATEVNLIPIMNLFVALIPFLLLAAAFYHVGVIPTSLPSQTEESSSVANEDIAVTVNLLIEAETIKLTVSNAVLSEEVLAALAVSIPKQKEGFDLPSLSQALAAIKTKFPKSDTVVVLPTDNVKYDVVIKVLDASREQSITQNGKDIKIPLFPVVVLSRKV